MRYNGFLLRQNVEKGQTIALLITTKTHFVINYRWYAKLIQAIFKPFNLTLTTYSLDSDLSTDIILKKKAELIISCFEDFPEVITLQVMKEQRQGYGGLQIYDETNYYLDFEDFIGRTVEINQKRPCIAIYRPL